MRISNEDGREASARNFGRLAMMLIPLALALGASAWLGVYIGVHQLRHELSQEERAAIFVGAEAPARGPMIIDTSKQTLCAGITHADVDGTSLRLYAKNDCKTPLTGMDWHYEMLSPDGTVLHHGMLNQYKTTYCPTPRLAGDAAECIFAGSYDGIPVDSRVDTLRVWTIPYSEK